MIVYSYIALNLRTVRPYTSFTLVKTSEIDDIDELVAWGVGLIKKIDRTTFEIDDIKYSIEEDNFIYMYNTKEHKMYVNVLPIDRLDNFLKDDMNHFVLNYRNKITFI